MTVRRSLPLVVAALAIATIAVALLAGSTAPPGTVPTGSAGAPASSGPVIASGSAVPSGSAQPGEAVGLIVDVESASLTDVRGFTLRTADGTETRYRMGVLENGAEFPPGHLVEHQVTAEPVRVFFREENGERVAYRIDDAPRS